MYSLIPIPPAECGGPRRGMSRAVLWQVRLAHQVAVALARGPAALVDGPYHQALPSAAVARREHTRDAGRILLVLGLDVGAGVAGDAHFLEECLLGPEETHRQ